MHKLITQLKKIMTPIKENNDPDGAAKAARQNISNELFVKRLLKTN